MNIFNNNRAQNNSYKGSGMSASKKGKALLIALLNINLIVVASGFQLLDLQVVSQAITSILFLVGAFVSFQGTVDFASAWRSGDYGNQGQQINKSGGPIARNLKMQYYDK